MQKKQQVRKLLIVEGQGDKDFFEKLFEKILNETAIQVIKIETPFDLFISNRTDENQEISKKDIKKNTGKEGVKNQLITHIKEDSDAEYTWLGCVMDADYGTSQNITHILTELCKKTKDYSYDTFEQCQESGGYYLKSNDGLRNVGIWFMPNNHEQGMLEDWLLKIAKSDENDLIKYANTVCKKAPRIKFKEEYTTKAQVAVWTALQKSPHLGTENIILQNLYNSDSDAFKNFITWLKFIFKEQ